MTEVARRSKVIRILFAIMTLCALPRIANSEPSVQARATPLYGAYLAGVHAQILRDYATADNWLSAAWRADPQAPPVIARTFLAALANGRYDTARTLAADEIDRHPGNAVARLVLLTEELKAGEKSALASAEMLPKDGIHRFLRPFALAWTRAAAKDFDGAEAALDELNHFEDFAPLKYFQKGLIDDLAGRTEDAEGNFKSALAATTKINWRLAYVVGNFYLRHGRKQEAETLYRRFLKENVDSDLGRVLLEHPPAEPPRPIVSSPADGLAEALFDLASVLDTPQTRDLALIYARLALGLRPDMAVTKLLLADILSAEGHPRQSLDVLAQIPSTSPYSWSARLRIAANLDAADDRAKAIGILKGMTQAEPSWTGAPIELGDVLREAKRFAEAADAYQEAIRRLQAGDIPVQWSLYYSLGIVLDRAGHWQDAEKALLEALKLKPDEPFVLNYLGYSWVDRGQNLHRALKLLEKAVSLRPDDGYIVDSLGWAHYQLRDYARAVKYLERATELVPDDPTINDHLGDAYWRAGRPREARFEWRQALEFGPKKSEIKPIEAKLERGLGPAGGG